MPSYEGVVTAISGEGSATVMLRPDSPGVVGAPGLKLCHAATGGSFVTFESANPAGAEVGDRVLVTVPGGAHLGNFLLFLALMLVGVVLGFLMFRLVDNRWAFSAYAGALVLLAALVPGALLTVFLLRRKGRGADAVIDRVIQKQAAGTETVCGDHASRNARGATGCKGCGAAR